MNAKPYLVACLLENARNLCKLRDAHIARRDIGDEVPAVLTATRRTGFPGARTRLPPAGAFNIFRLILLFTPTVIHLR